MFEPLSDISRQLVSFPHPWWFAGGWAIDVFVGAVTREHEDVEISIFREHQLDLFDHLRTRGLELAYAHDGNVVPWTRDRPLELPDFQLKIHFEKSGGFDVFLDDRIGDTWICRRCPALTRPVDSITLPCPESTGLAPARFLSPEIELLFKAKHQLPKNDHDFTTALPLLSAERRAWLADAVRLCHPDHPWRERLPA